MSLRPYQFLALLDVERGWRAGHRGQVLVLPTGAGKTHVAHAILDRVFTSGGCACWLAHLDLLLAQSASTAAKYGHAPSIIGGDNRHFDSRAHFHLISMQTAGKRLDRIVKQINPDVIVIDEGHRSPCATYERVLSAWPNARRLLLTATPWRADGRGLRSVADAIITTTTPEKLIAAGHLVPFELRAPRRCDMTGAAKRGGEFTAVEADRRIAPGLGDVVRGTCDAIRDGRGPAVVFCTSIATSKALAQRLCDYGVRAEHLDADTDSDEREAILGERGRVATGETEAICWVGLGDEGVDVPLIGTIVLASPTASSGRYLQRVGRGSRPVLAPDGSWALRPDGTPVKPSCLVLDYGGNIERHGLPTEDLSPWYSLDGDPYARRAADEDAEKPVQLTTCKACFAVFRVALRRSDGGCPSCGHIELQKPVAFVDRGTMLDTVEAAQVVPWAERWEAWDAIVAVCAARGYRPGWAGMQYRAKFGRQAWPTSAMQARLRQAIEAHAAGAAEAAP